MIKLSEVYKNLGVMIGYQCPHCGKPYTFTHSHDDNGVHHVGAVHTCTERQWDVSMNFAHGTEIEDDLAET